MQTEITFNQAIHVHKHVRKANKQRFEYLMQEIKDSTPECLTATDFNYYASELTETNPDGKTYTANEVRNMMGEGKDVDFYDWIGTFEDDETDSIIDFF